MIDVLLINPGGRKKIYQNLANTFAAKEPPLWVGLIAHYLKNKGFKVEVLDADAKDLSPEEVGKKVNEINPLLTAIVVYGQNPTASTPKMAGASPTAKMIRNYCPETKIIFLGLHPSALPKRTLLEEETDFICQGEGPYTLEALIKVLKEKGDIKKVPGLWFKKDEEVLFTYPAPLIKNLDKEIPIMAYELLPMDKYIAHNWHCFENLDERSPYGVIYTSLGCPFNCFYCPINTPFGKSGIRFLGLDKVIKQVEVLVEKYSVKNIKIVDELFVLKKDRVEKFCDSIIKRGYDLNIWAYARIDTVEEKILEKMRNAGIKWLALGIESANKDIREKVNKRLSKDIFKVVRMIKNAGIYVIGNYIFGLPDDNYETMKETLNMAKELNCEFANFYVAMAYPGSKLYEYALKNNWKLPKTWAGYAQLSEETLPLPTKYLSPKEVLKFRDNAFYEYFTNKNYLKMIKEKFGERVVAHIKEMTSFKIKRKYEC